MRRRYSVPIALSISLFVYLFYRSEKTMINELAVLFLSFDLYAATKTTISKTIPLNEAIIFSLPGGLWVFCATALSLHFYMKIGSYKVQVFLVPVLFAIGLEFCQLIHLTNGTFDLWDIAFYLLFWFLAYYCIRSDRQQQNIMAPFTMHGFICLACFLLVFLAHVRQ